MNSALRFLTASWPWTAVDVLNHLWQSTVVAVVVLATLALGRGLAARTRRALGWMALVKFALPAGFFAGMFARLGPAPGHWVEPGAFTRPIMLPAFIVTASAGDAPARVSAGALLVGVWLAGFAALFLSWFVRGRILRRRILAETQPVSSALTQRVAAAADRAELGATPSCLAVGSERGPGVLGVFAPIVILPRGLETTLAPAELDSVLIHECVHVQRRDNLSSAVQAFFVSLFWFHPVVWLLNRRLAVETEQSCDERVLEITGDPDTYAGGIVKAVQHALGVAQPGLIGATTPPVVTRIKNIFAHGARRDRPLVRGAVLAGGVVLLALSGYTGSFAAQSLAAKVTEPAAPVAAPASIASTPAAPAPVAPVAAPVEQTLSVDFPNEDIRTVLRNVADLYQINVVFPVELTGKATVKLKDATWRQIYRIILAPVGYTFVEEGNMVRVIPADSLSATSAPVPAPVAIGSLPARAAQARLAAQADHLKREAEALQREVEAYQAARGNTPETESDPQAAAMAAGLEAMAARQRALEAAQTAAGDAAQMAEMTAKRTAEAEQERAQTAQRRALEAERQRALAAEDRAARERAVALAAADARLKAPSGDGVQPTPKAVLGSAVDVALARLDQGAPDELRARGIKVFDLSEVDRVPVATFQARPRYPTALRRGNVSGEATIDFVVAPNGDVLNARAVKFTHEEFAAAAVAAVSQWKFKPGQKEGATVYTHMQVPIVFTLNEN